jgi:hypothetical protein
MLYLSANLSDFGWVKPIKILDLFSPRFHFLPNVIKNITIIEFLQNILKNINDRNLCEDLRAEQKLQIEVIWVVKILETNAFFFM